MTTDCRCDGIFMCMPCFFERTKSDDMVYGPKSLADIGY